MKKIGEVEIAGVTMDVISDEDAVREPFTLMAAIYEGQSQEELDARYVPGTKRGYFCALCGAECILAPSGQKYEAVGNKTIVCMKCAIAGAFTQQA